MATIKEIARKAGVSIGTVDRVLHNRGMVNEQTKERIEAVMKELHYRPNQVAQGLAVMKKKLKIVFFIPDVTDHPFFHDVACAARKKARELEQYGVQVTFIQMGISEDPMASNGMFCSLDGKVCESELLGQDGIVMMGIDTPAARNYLEFASQSEIPVVFYNTFLPGQDFLAYVGCDYVKSGRLAAGLAALAGGEEARICIYSEGNGSISSHRERVEGFCQEVSLRYPQMKILDIGLIDNSQERNEWMAQEMLCKYPDVNIVYVVNPRDYGICRAIASADSKRQVRIITNDLVESQVELVRQGIISATICQEPQKQGEHPLEILFQYLAYGKVPKERMCYTNLSIHIAQNL